MLGIITVIPLIIVSFLLYGKYKSGITEIIEEEGNHTLIISKNYFENKREDALHIAKRYAKSKDLIELFHKQDRESLDNQIKPLFSSMKKEYGLTVFEFGNKDGTVFTRE